MSYDINFWRQPTGYVVDPLTTYQRLCRGEAPDALRDLPVGRILAALRKHFPDFDPDGAFPMMHLPGHVDGSVEVWWSAKHFRFDLRGDTAEASNIIIDIMERFGCPMYDPQTNQRYAKADGHGVAPAPRSQPLTPMQHAEVERREREVKALAKMKASISNRHRTRARRRAMTMGCVTATLIAGTAAVVLTALGVLTLLR